MAVRRLGVRPFFRVFSQLYYIVIIFGDHTLVLEVSALRCSRCPPVFPEDEDLGV